MPLLDIPSSLRSALRAAAHPLKPVVLIGDKGLSATVLQEIDRNLTAHGLIKVRAGGEDRGAREVLLHEICDELGCAPVHHLGKIFILFRPTERDPDAAALLGGRQSKPDVTALGTGQRKPNEAHLPKKAAVAGKPAAPRAERSKRPARPPEPLTARERYLGTTEGTRRAPAREAGGPRRGDEAPRRPAAGLKSTLGAARKTAGTAATGRPRAPGSALSLRAGARNRPDARPQRPAATGRRPKGAAKK